jgi:hypothetical protein
MERKGRLRIALVLAALVHAVALVAPLPNHRATLAPAIGDRDNPLILSLRNPERPRYLVENGAPPKTEARPDTDLIAEKNSQAQDMSDATRDAERNAPRVERVDDAEDLGQATPPPPDPAPRSDPLIRPAESDPAPQNAGHAPGRENEPARPETGSGPGTPQLEPFQVARAEPPQPVPGDSKPSRGRLEGGVTNKGFLSFEAMESEIAPYLREVRARVERKWKAKMHLSYSGTSSTRAVLDCAIASDGKLAYVNVIEAGDSATYAGLCKRAIEEAGPFPPFPFKVPDVYRNQHLQIRWTFSFL